MVTTHKVLFMTSLAIAGILVLFGYATASASSDTTLSDAEIKSVQNNCITLKSTLDQLNYNDTALRVNQGQYYEEISTKLMAPMNSRIALNHYDGGDLVSVAAEYAKQIDLFRANYTIYAKALTKARRDNCNEHPQQFYNDITSAGAARQALHETVVKLNAMVENYQTMFKDFAKTLPTTSDGVSND